VPHDYFINLSSQGLYNNWLEYGIKQIDTSQQNHNKNNIQVKIKNSEKKNKVNENENEMKCQMKSAGQANIMKD